MTSNIHPTSQELINGPVETIPLIRNPQFKHRTVAEVWADEQRLSVAKGKR